MLARHISGGALVRKAMQVLEQLTPDSYSDFLLAFYGEGLRRFGDEWDYADINTVLIGLSATLKIQRYLEIGVRRGRSSAMVASQSPACDIAAFDLWVNNYAGMPNPGKDFVRAELASIGFSGRIEFVDGDSRDTVPSYLNANPEAYFDLITVDGDHSIAGARRDLANVIPRVKMGGGLVFDDISHPAHIGLGDTWRALVVDNAQFSSYSYGDVGFGVGVGLRKF
jgi:predicted O-methyltransferase YrrM